MNLLLQTGQSGRVPVPPEKRFLINPRHPGPATVSPMKALLQAGRNGRVPVLTEKRFLVSLRRQLLTVKSSRLVAVLCLCSMTTFAGDCFEYGLEFVGISTQIDTDTPNLTRVTFEEAVSSPWGKDSTLYENILVRVDAPDKLPDGLLNYKLSLHAGEEILMLNEGVVSGEAEGEVLIEIDFRRLLFSHEHQMKSLKFELNSDEFSWCQWTLEFVQDD